MLRVHAYVRYSSVMQDDGFSVEYQLKEIEDYCQRNNMILTKTHIDQAQTAKQVAGRESFFDLLNCIVNNEVDVVIVYKMNRMFRNAEESHVYRKKFRQHKVKIISVTEPIDEETSAGRLTANMLANLDQYQSEVIADFVKSSHREMTRQGYFTGGVIPVGFKTQSEEHGKKIRKRLVIDENVAPFVRRAFEMFADGYNVRYIVRFLRENNVKSPIDRFVRESVLRRMFRNDVYIGTIRYKTDGYSEMVVEDAIPAMIDRDIWDRCQARKDNSRFGISQRKRIYPYPLTGKIFCACCGDHFFGVSNNRHMRKGNVIVYRYYICKTKRNTGECEQKQIRADFVEQVALRAIREHILNDEAIKEIAKRAAELSGHAPAEIQADIKRIKKQIKDHDETLDLFIEMRKKREMSPETLTRKSASIEAEIEELNRQLADLESKNVKAISPEDVEKYLRKMMQMLDSNDADVHHVLFENFIDAIFVTNDHVEVRLFVCFHDVKVMYKSPSVCPNGFLYTQINRPKIMPYTKRFR